MALTKITTNAFAASSVDSDAIASGAVTSSKISIDGNISFPDNNKAIFGASSDLQIYHDGSNSHIKDTATGNLNISGNDIQILNAASNTISSPATNYMKAMPHSPSLTLTLTLSHPHAHLQLIALYVLTGLLQRHAVAPLLCEGGKRMGLSLDTKVYE